MVALYFRRTEVITCTLKHYLYFHLYLCVEAIYKEVIVTKVFQVSNFCLKEWNVLLPRQPNYKSW